MPYVVRAVLGMYGPALAAWLVRGPLMHEGFADAGLGTHWRTGGRPSSILALVVVPLCLAVGAALALAAHVQHVDPIGNMLALARQSGIKDAPTSLTTGSTNLSALVLIGAAVLVIAPFVNGIFAFGEEFGWRGYLLPRLYDRIGTWPAIVSVGIVWGVWHAPLILLDGLNYPTHRWLGLGLTTIFCIAMSAFFAALRLRSNSIWPSTLAHGALNAQASVVTVLLAPMEGVLNAPIGLLGALPFALAALVLLRARPSAASFPDLLPRTGLP